MTVFLLALALTLLWTLLVPGVIEVTEASDGSSFIGRDE
jgi:hypothetical protein